MGNRHNTWKDRLSIFFTLFQPWISRFRRVYGLPLSGLHEKRVQAGVKTTPDKFNHRTKRFRVYHPVHPLLASMPLTFSSSSGHCYNRVHQYPGPRHLFSLFFQDILFDIYFQKSILFVFTYLMIYLIHISTWFIYYNFKIKCF